MFYETRNGFFQLRWSPDGRKIAITYLASPFSNNNSDIGVLSLKDRTFSPVVTWEGEDTNPSWSPDGERLAFASEGSIKGMAPFPVVDSVFVVNTNSPQTIVRAASGTGETRIWWDPGGKLLRLAMDTRTHSGLYEVPATGGRMKRILGSEDHAAQFSFDSSQGKVAFVVQNLTKPPNVGVLDLRTGTSATLTDLNPQFRNITMGQMSELTWKNQYGNETNGFLIKPVGYTAGRRYPLLLILYGFHREFTIQAQWIPDYPAQVFAANGFAVLLVNYPKMSKWRYGDFDEGFRNEVQNPLSSIERAVDLAERLGIADPHKVGIMGWSMGGFWTNLAVTYSHLFASASSGEAARRDPVAYWTQGSPFEDFLDGIVGGPPVSANYKHWRQYAPSLRKPLGRTPVLFEYQAGDPAGLETFESWRKQDAPVELVLYPNEGHVFVQPRHQLYSMQLNLDWFRFWLKGEEDNDPLKVDQYTRWRVLKKQAQQGTAN
jgi:dipeptidyl aminopeptidase/acylaminoacyl peptidase